MVFSSYLIVGKNLIKIIAETSKLLGKCNLWQTSSSSPILLFDIPCKKERGINRCLAIVVNSHNVASPLFPAISIDSINNITKADAKFKAFLYCPWNKINTIETVKAIAKVISFL